MPAVIGADGRETGRTAAATRRTPKSYLPIMLTADTDSVLLVVTKLPLDPRPPGASDLRHGFELVLDTKH